VGKHQKFASDKKENVSDDALTAGGDKPQTARPDGQTKQFQEE
jgi:hypothetical protein